MEILVRYPADPATAAPRLFSPQQVWAVARQVRRQLGLKGGDIVSADMLMARVRAVDINGRRFAICWEADFEVHDDDEQAVLGVCETVVDNPGVAHVLINGPRLAGRPDLLASTAAHELGHVIFDMPGGHRHYRAVTRSAGALLAAERIAEWRTNEFMGGLLVEPAPLHRDLLRCAREERLRLVRAPHYGRPGSPVVDARNDPDALAGVVAVLAEGFGVSESFIDTRLRRYRLIADMGGRS